MRITLDQAVQYLQSGQVVAVPTETVYGLAGSLAFPSAIEKIFALKGRPLVNPLIIHVAEKEEIDPFVSTYPPYFEELAKTFWPGPLTLILSVNDSVPSLARAGLPTAGFRIPSHEVVRTLLKKTGPLVMPSANISGRPSSTTPDHIEQDFGLDFPLLDGGDFYQGVESTILLFEKERWAIVRQGAIPSDAFQQVLSYQPAIIGISKDNRPLCPGQLFRHYSPQGALITHLPLTTSPFILGFKERIYPPNKKVILLGSLHNPSEVAKNLYQSLRQLDLEKAEETWVDMDFPHEGLWLTIRERLTRASSKQ